MLLLFANPGDVAAREHTQKRAQCKKYAWCCNKKPKQTIDGSGNCKVGAAKKMNSVAFPAAVNMANVRGAVLCKTPTPEKE